MKKPLFLILAIMVCASGSLFADALLRTGDSFDLRIGGVPSDDQATISSNYTIDGEGFLNLSLIGKIRAAGKTVSEFQSLVERTYVEQGIFTHPTITLTIAPSARFVNIGGPGIKSGGRIPYTPDMTLLSAITAAGDFNEFADQKKVRLMRGSDVKIINVKKIRADPSQDLKVLPGDNIQVPETIF